MVIPIFANKKLNGYIGFDNPEPGKSAFSLRLLQAVGGHIGGLKENLYMMDRLENNITELSREKNILDALCIDYTVVHYCDLVADTMFTIKQGNDTNDMLAQQRMPSDVNVYSNRIKYYYENFVIKESAPDFKYKMSAAYLMDYLSRHQRFAYRFRTVPNPAGKQYFEVQFVRLHDIEGFKVVMGYRYIDDIVAEEEQQKIRLENALAEATLNSEIIDAISRIYLLIYRMDLIRGTYEEISAGREMHRLTGKHGKTEEVFREARENIVAPEYQSMMKEFLDTSTLPDRLRRLDSIAMEYHASNGSWHLARFIVKKRDCSGEVTNVLYVVRVIDDEKKKEIEYKQKIVESAQDAYRANLAKTDFLRRMSHDIRTPINGILGMVAIADRYPEDVEKLKECRGKVKQAAEFLLDLVNNVLDMNKLESGVVTLEHEPFDIYDVVKRVNSITEMNGQNKGLKVIYEPDRIKHSRLIGSHVHLQQILQNVAGNAVKYTEEGGSIRFSCNEIKSEKGKAVYRFVCSDTGRGMSEEFLEHAFEPFAQESNDARTSYMGTGLGLTITKQLVEMMNGTIDVKSKAGEGTTFTITLPFEIDSDYRDPADIEETFEEKTLAGLKVLLVEDNELNMEIARFFLEEAKVSVVTAENGKEAVDIFKASGQGTLDLILMDIMMPVMDGIEAAKKIRMMDRPDAKMIPIIAMTANAFADDKQKTKEAGMDAHLSKPLNEKSLMEIIKKYVTKNKT